jgi:lipooligosaccharide transport system permease protein
MSMARPALRVAEYNLLAFQKSWKSAVMLYVVSPVLFLSAMGLGLGGLVASGRGSVAGVSYLQFLAPGLMVATAMQTATSDATYPIMNRLLWSRIYEAMLNTPLRARDVLGGELLWMAVRLGVVSLVFYIVALCFGAGRSPLSVVAVPVAVLTGVAFAAPVLAYTATQRNDHGFSALMRFIVLPLFLLGGSFFPVTQLPRFLQGVAWTTPLTHGVALARDLYLGVAGMPSAMAHLAVLLAYVVAGVAVARFTMTRRLVV